MNQRVELAEIANRLVSYGVPGFSRPTSRLFPRTAENISIPPAAQADYYKAVQELYQFDKSLSKMYSLKTFEKNVMRFIAPFVHTPQVVEKEAVSAFIRELSERPLVAQEVLRPIYQITKSADSGPVVRGRFTIYNTVADAAALNVVLRGIMDEVVLDSTEHYLIRTTVEARDEVLALELADALFEQFENAVRFMVGPESRFDARVFGWTGPVPVRSIIMSSVTWSSAVGSEGSSAELDVDDSYFLDAEVGYDRIWQNLGVSSASPLMKKILLAVDWVGQSIAEKVPSSAFIKAAIALEVLFTPEKGTFAPSIVFQITENVVLLLGTEPASRIEWEREFKRLYNIRSSVAHAGKTDVERSDLLAIQYMARQVITKLLVSPALKDCASPDDLAKVLKSLKYDCPPLS